MYEIPVAHRIFSTPNFGCEHALLPPRKKIDNRLPSAFVAYKKPRSNCSEEGFFCDIRRLGGCIFIMP